MVSVGDVARRRLVTCRVNDDVPAIASIMVDAEVGSVFVEDQAGRIVGLVTDGSIFRLVAQRKPLEDIKAEDIMVREIRTVDGKAPLSEAWRIFQETGIKRLAVTEEGRIVGVLSRKVVQRIMKYEKAVSLARS